MKDKTAGCLQVEAIRVGIKTRMAPEIRTIAIPIDVETGLATVHFGASIAITVVGTNRCAEGEVPKLVWQTVLKNCRREG